MHGAKEVWYNLFKCQMYKQSFRLNISLTKANFVGFYYTIILQCTVQKNKIYITVYCKRRTEHKASALLKFHEAVGRIRRKAPHIQKFDSGCV